MVSSLLDLFEQARTGLATAQQLVAFWGPLMTVPASAPLLAVASVVALALLVGIAVGTLSTLLVVLLALHLLLTEVFGVSVDITAA